jgi:hypothetical protein
MTTRRSFRVAVTAVLALAAAVLVGAGPAEATLSGVGPTDPATGLPTYYQDDTGLRLQPCLLDTVSCVPGSTVPDPTAPPSVSTGNLAPEEFYYAADAKIAMPGGGQGLLTVGLENGWTSTTQCGKGFCPEPGKQAIFGRVRFRIDGLTPGLQYTVRYPWGTQTVTPVGTVGGKRSVNLTIDIGCPATAGAPTCDPTAALGAIVGPFLGWDPAVAPAAPAGFLGSYAVPHAITGSRVLDQNGQPQNYFSIEGPDIDTLRTDLFSVAGQIARPAVTDTTPPAVPQGLTATASGPNAAVIGWQPSVDAEGSAVTYRVYREGVPLSGAPTAATTLTDTGLAGGTTYGYQVTALDAAGNESAPSAEVNVTTPPDPVVTPPSAPGPVTAVVPATTLGTSAVPVQLGWAASTSSAGVTGYDVSVTSPDGGTGVSSSFSDSSASVSLAPGHSYEAAVRGRSADGLVSPWTRRSFTVALAQENDASVTYSKGWGRKKVSGASGGWSQVTSTAKSTATVRFTGTAVAWAATAGPTGGVASVSLDGTSLGTVDLHGASATPRRLVLARSGLAPGAHTLVVTFPTATGKGKTATSIDLDAIATLR